MVYSHFIIITSSSSKFRQNKSIYRYFCVELESRVPTDTPFHHRSAGAPKTSANHCVKRVRIRSYSAPHFSLPGFHLIGTEYGEIRNICPYSVQMRENSGKMWTRITPNTDSFYAVKRFNPSRI